MLLKNFGKCYTINVPKLEKKGLIRKEASKFRTIELLVENEFEEKSEDIVKVPEFSNHCMRSSYITRCAENKVDINVVMAQVGHSSSRVTHEIYLTVNPDWMERELAVMENMLK